jgi:hypothetical protein
MPREIYYYNVVDLEKHKHKIKHSIFFFTTHIHANLYNKDNEIVGQIFSINEHFIHNKISNVTTLTTYNTFNGTIVCNWNYSSDKHYLSGKKETTPTFKDGKYNKKNVKLELEGFSDKDGTRELIINY